MTAPAVCLHIGAMKTGTTYVQRMLGSNHEQLARDGIVYPMPWSDQVEAVRDVLELKGGSHLGSIEGHWKLMADRLHEWSGPRAILSVEFLSFASAAQIRAIVSDLAPSEVTVVMGVRDLARAVPAQWQTAVRNGKGSTYRQYLKGLTAKRPTKTKMHFWKRQDVGRIAADWAKVLGRENVSVVTVPPAGADPGELWRRMSIAMQLDAGKLHEGTTSNESLGPTGTELLRRVNQQADATGMSTWIYQHGINRALSHQVMPNIADPYPSLRVPDEYRGWVRDESARVMAELRAADVTVVGDLADLEPELTPPAPFIWPEDVPESDLLTFAVAALTGLGNDVAERKRSEIESGGKKRRAGARRREQTGPGA